MMAPLLLGILIGGITAYIAQIRGRNLFLWFGLGVLLGVFALLILLLLPSEREEEIEMQKKMKEEQKESEIFTNAIWHFLDKEHKNQGKGAFEEVKKNWEEGSIDPATLVWAEGMGEWEKIENVPELIKNLKKIIFKGPTT